MATTQYSPLFGDSYTAVDGLLPSRNRLRSLALRSGFRKYSGLFKALIGAASGGTATKTHVQVAEDVQGGAVGAGGGQRTIETVTDISRATTAGDITALKALLTDTVYFMPHPYVVDLSGNGGPAFTGT